MQVKLSCTEKIPSFAAAIRQLDISSFPISDYSKRYLGYLLEHPEYFLAIYSEVLDRVAGNAHQDFGSMTFVDYGAGNGLLGMFAKHCGMKTVIICDMDPGFVEAAKYTASQLNITIDSYVCGDIQLLARAAIGKQIDVVAGTDVIEHIYDLEHFFSSLRQMNEAMLTVFTTASNPANYFKVRKLKKLQSRDELEGSSPTDSILAGAYAQEAFIKSREKIIRGGFPHLANEQYRLLARYTRGFREADILNATKNYLDSGILPPLEPSGTNTCDPYSGSWTERVLPLDYYEDLYRRNGFKLSVTPGFYNSYGAGFKTIVNKIRNAIIKLTGINTSPFITLTGANPK